MEIQSPRRIENELLSGLSNALDREMIQNMISSSSSPNGAEQIKVETVKTRCSPRLQNRLHQKRSYNALDQKSLPPRSKKKKDKKIDISSVTKDFSDPVAKTDVHLENVALPLEKVVVKDDLSDHSKVKETLRIFNRHYLYFIQEEEKRCKKDEVKDVDTPNGSKRKNVKSPKAFKSKGAKTSKDSKSKGIFVTLKDAPLHQHPKQDRVYKGTAKRPDLKAITKMTETKAILYPEKKFGHLPGIDVGHQFYSRAEMVVLGFHGHWLKGIDFMGPIYGELEEYKGYTFPLAVSIVLSGQYEDDVDNSEDVVYTGEGGNNMNGNKRQNKDQVMLRGNLALKHNAEQCVPVRVIRGHDCASSYCGRVYTYDGLYKVVQYWAETGVSGFSVFKFRLKRLEGQPPLTTTQVQFARAHAPTSISELRGLVSKDISEGQEDVPIPATNLVDDPPVAPTGYTYVKSNKVAESVKHPITATGCGCQGTCTDPSICACARLNGSDFPYVRRDGGRLVNAKSVVFECGPNCGCGPSCINRTSQRGLKYRFEVFRTPKKGWAVRSWDYIPSGAPVCEYVGMLMRTDDLDSISDNNYIFDIDCLQTMKGLDGRERRLEDVAIPSEAHLDEIDDKKLENAPEFCIDAGSIGNIARFFNHSCEPNLFVQCVLSSHHNIKLARVMLFAADNIPPMQELTYDYGYALDSVMGPDGNIKRMPCYCGAAGCRRRLY